MFRNRKNWVKVIRHDSAATNLNLIITPLELIVAGSIPFIIGSTYDDWIIPSRSSEAT